MLTICLARDDETITVRVVGTVEKQADQLVAPTTSIPLILTLPDQ